MELLTKAHYLTHRKYRTDLLSVEEDFVGYLEVLVEVLEYFQGRAVLIIAHGSSKLYKVEWFIGWFKVAIDDSFYHILA